MRVSVCLFSLCFNCSASGCTVQINLDVMKAHPDLSVSTSTTELSPSLSVCFCPRFLLCPCAFVVDMMSIVRSQRKQSNEACHDTRNASPEKGRETATGRQKTEPRTPAALNSPRAWPHESSLSSATTSQEGTPANSQSSRQRSVQQLPTRPFLAC